MRGDLGDLLAFMFVGQQNVKQHYVYLVGFSLCQSTNTYCKSFNGEFQVVFVKFIYICVWLQATSWQVPPEVAELRKKQEDSAPKSVVDGPSVTAPTTEKSPVSFTLHIPAAITGGREAVGHKANSNSALDLIKKKLQDSGAPITVLPAAGNISGVATAGNGGPAVDVSNGKGVGIEGGKEKLHKGDHASSDESSDSEEEDPGPTKEQKIAEFKVNS